MKPYVLLGGINMFSPLPLKRIALIAAAVCALALSGFAQTSNCVNDPVYPTCWSYSGSTGPAYWGNTYPTCNPASFPEVQQAPIILTGQNVANRPVVNTNLRLTTNYEANSTFQIKDKGYTVQANYTGTDLNTVIFQNGSNSKTYKLLQIHFHEPTEHQIAQYGPQVMEVHLVHQGSDQSYLVIGVLINAPTTGADNAAYAEVENGYKNHGPVVFNPALFLPGGINSSSFNFFTYTGTLTTPPCAPNITFVVLNDPITISSAQQNWYPYANSSRGPQAWIGTIDLQANWNFQSASANKKAAQAKAGESQPSHPK